MCDEIVENGIDESENEKIRKVFLDDLPRKEYGAGKGGIDWTASIGYKIKFQYDNLTGEVEIIDYIKKNQKIVLKYLNKGSFEIATSSFSLCNLGEMIGTKTKKYKYNVGEIIKIKNNNIEIIEQTRINYGKNIHKAYKYKCEKCGNIDIITEGHIKENKGCSVCSSQKIVKGINDIATTHPEYVKYFVNPEDAYKCSSGGDTKVLVKCPNCNTEKLIAIHKLIIRNYGCKACGDGVPYPEKIVFNLLKQLDNKFEKEKVFKWSKNVKHENPKLCGDKRYDFYISSNNCIIESHGEQHYTKTFETTNGKTLQEEQENDRLKEQLAKDNGIEHYIVIDCRKSDLEWIKNSIMNSELPKLLNFKEEDIDWLKCHEYACNSLVKEACDLWNDGKKDTKEIAEIMKTTRNTVSRYLKQGRKINLCDYETKYVIKDKNMIKACELWNSGVNNIKEIGELLKLEPYKINNYLNECCKLNLCKYNGYDEKFKALQKEVICLENNIIFDSITEASKKSLNIFNKKLHACNISAVCNGDRKSTGGYHFKFV